MSLTQNVHCLIYGILFLMCFYITAEEYRPCPEGFDLSYDEKQNDYICYKLKEPETFNDKYVDCEENIYTLELHFRLNITRYDKVTFWIDYSSLYPGGPYVDSESKKDVTSIMHTTTYDTFNNNKKLCLVVTNMGILTAVECDEMHNRYCFVKSNLRNSNSNSHQDLQSFQKITKNLCLLTVNSTSYVTWIEAKSLCEDKEGSEVDMDLSYRNITRQERKGEVVSYAANRNIEPEELIDQVLHDMKQLLENEADPILVEDLFSVFDQVDYLLDLELDLVFPGELIYLLHELSPRVDLLDTGVANVIRDKISLVISTQLQLSGITGLRVLRSDRFTTSSVHYLIFGMPFEQYVNPNDVDAVVAFPNSVNFPINRFNFLVLWDDALFHDSRGIYTVNSRVIYINLVTAPDTVHLITNIYLRPLVPEASNVRRTCVRWHFSDDGTGSWTEDDCTLIKSDNPAILDICECYMLTFTYYAEALIPLTTEELLEQLLNDLRLLLDSEFPPVSEIDHIFDQLNDLLELDEAVMFPDELLHLLQELGLSVDLSWDLTSATVRSNSALLISSGQAATRGITVARNDDNIFMENTFNFLSDDIDLPSLEVNVYDAVLTIPQEVTWLLIQMSNIVFRDDSAFYDSRGSYTVISRILSINVLTSVDLESEDYEIFLHLRSLMVDSAESDTTPRPVCVRWLSQDEIGYWSEDGCELIISDDPELLYTCKCKLFMTYYAMALFSETVTTTETTITDGTTTSLETTITDSTTTSPVTITTEIITMRPEEQIQQVLEDLYLLLNQTSPILVDDISHVLDQIDDLLNLDIELDFPGQMLSLLEELGMRIDLNGFDTAEVVRNNIALLMADATEDNPVRGVIVASRDTDIFTQDAFEFLIGELDSSLLNVNVSEAVVSLPVSVTRCPRRISFLVYRNARAFSYDRDIFAINSRILSISVGNHSQFERGEVVDIHLKPEIAEPNRDERRVCTYWRFSEDWTGYWSQEGCTLIKSRNPWTLDTCRCDHLTHFAEVLIPRTVFSKLNEDILEILSIIGCILSILGLIVIILTAVLFRSWRKNFRNQIWLQLCVALFLMSVLFLITVFLKYDKDTVSCILTGIGLHYSILASFCWMLVVAVKSYNDLVVVYTKQVPHKRLIASGFSWGVPVLIVCILLLVNSQSYSGHFEEMNPSSNFCYPSGISLWVAVYMPIAVMLLANWIIFILIAQKIGFTSRGVRSHKAGDRQEALVCIRVSVVLVFLFGLPWLFGLFAYKVVAAYFFTCTVTTQGFVLFMLIIGGNAQTRNLWFSKLKRKQKKLFTVTSNF